MASQDLSLPTPPGNCGVHRITTAKPLDIAPAYTDGVRIAKTKEEMEMDEKVVFLSDLAHWLNTDRSHFTRWCKKQDVRVFRVIHPVDGQNQSAVVASDARKLVELRKAVEYVTDPTEIGLER